MVRTQNCKNNYGRNCNKNYGSPQEEISHRSIFNKATALRRKPVKDGSHGRGKRDKTDFYNNSMRQSHPHQWGRRENYHQMDKDSYSGWNEIVVKIATEAAEDDLIAAIRQHVKLDFSPIMAEFSSPTNFHFFIENGRKSANAMLNMSNRITLENGQKLKISVYEKSPPFKIQSPEKYEIIKEVIRQRFNIERKCIDLKDFHKDPNLIQSKVYFPLYDYEALTTVVHIIKENLPHVEEVNIGSNGIFNPKPLSALWNSNIKRLNLESNKINRLHYFKSMSNLEITHLNLTRNPIKKRVKSPVEYIMAMKKIFPKLKYLDGMELPKVPGFDINDSLPTSQGSQYFSDDAKEFVETFIEQYYQAYENNNRQALAAAYTEDACFSIVCCIPDHIPISWHSYNEVFKTNDRNLLREIDDEKRFTNLVQGQQDITDMLCSMPKSLHDPTSFLVDVPIAQAQFLQVCLRGLVTFVDDNNSILRSFSRSLIIVPVGDGFCISNETLFVCSPSPELKMSKSTNVIIESLPSTSHVMPAMLTDGLNDIQIKMTKLFSQQSNMKSQFSKACLEKNDWDFDKAAELFMSLKLENKLPEEYFDA